MTRNKVYPNQLNRLKRAKIAWPYSKEPKGVTAFNLFTFFRADLTQSEASWKLSSTSD